MNNEVEIYTKRAVQLRSEGRLVEAVLAARKAISLDGDDANAWWQLALAQEENGGAVSAMDALAKVVHLAPGFPGGWCEYALAHQKTERADEAVILFETALEADADHIRSMRLLAQLLDERGQNGDTQRRLGLLRRLEHLGELTGSEQFDLAFLLAAASEDLEAARTYEALTRKINSEPAFFNLALLYRRIGRDADAFDAFRIAQRITPDDKATAERIDAVVTQLGGRRT